MASVQWEQGFRRLTTLVSGVLLAIGLVWSTVYGGSVAVTVTIAVFPWVVFLLARWIARGFAPKPAATDTVEAMKLVDEVATRLSEGRITPEMAEEIFASLPRDQLLLVQKVHGDGLTALENKMRSIVEKGAREGKTISLEKALKPMIDQRDSYIGADRDEVVEDLDRLITGLRERYGPEIPADEAYKLMRELEGRARGED